MNRLLRALAMTMAIGLCLVGALGFCLFVTWLGNHYGPGAALGVFGAVIFIGIFALNYFTEI